MSLADAEEIIFHLLLADTNLGTVSVQAEHLNRSVRVNPYVPIISQQVSMNIISQDSLFLFCVRLFSDPEYQNYN